jgi:hypothetical protein
VPEIRPRRGGQVHLGDKRVKRGTQRQRHFVLVEDERVDGDRKRRQPGLIGRLRAPSTVERQELAPTLFQGGITASRHGGSAQTKCAKPGRVAGAAARR